MTASSQEPLLSLESLAVHAGREDLTGLGVHAPPIDLSTTYPLPDIDAGGLSYEAMATGGHPLADGGAVYARLWNPTVARFESALARLEGTGEAVAFSSGMAALTAVVLAMRAETGRRHVVVVRPVYGGTDHLLGSGLLDVEATYVSAGRTAPGGTAEAVAEAVREDTGLVIVETPANPTLDLVDIEAVVRAAADRPVLVDNTFATPVLQQPTRHGAHLVLHSATKYLGGHGDVIGGVVATTAGWAAALRRVRTVTGALLHPLAGYLLHRGLATLPVRVRAQQTSAGSLAGWLREHPAVAQVFYPGLPGCDPHGLVGRQMAGPGAMLSIRLAGGYRHAAAVTRRLRLFTHAVSLGGVDSLIQHPAALTHRPVPEDARPGGDILRLSIGLENVDDLRRDLDQALSAASETSDETDTAPGGTACAAGTAPDAASGALIAASRP